MFTMSVQHDDMAFYIKRDPGVAWVCQPSVWLTNPEVALSQPWHQEELLSSCVPMSLWSFCYCSRGKELKT